MQTYIFGIKMPSKRKITALAYTLLFVVALIGSGHLEKQGMIADGWVTTTN